MRVLRACQSLTNPMIIAGVLAMPMNIAEPAVAQTALAPIVIETPSPVVQPQPVDNAADAPVQPPAAAALPNNLILPEDVFAPVTIVTDREVITTDAATIGGVLANKPGISSTAFAAGANRPIIRGLDSYRVRVQENGIGSHSVAAISEDHAEPVSPFAADRIEVVRGPATLRFGSQAIGGVVSVENERVPKSVPKNGFAGEVQGGLTSVSEGRDGGFRIRAGAQGVVVTADAYRRRSEDYDTPRGRQFNTFAESDGYSVGASRVWTDGYIGVAYTRYEAFYGIPGEEAGEERPRIDLGQDKVLARGEWRVRNFGVEAVRFWFGASDYSHDEVIDDGGTDIVGTRFTNKEYEGRLEVQHQRFKFLGGDLTGAAGLQYGKRKTAGFPVAEPVDGLLDRARTESIAGFVFEELQVSPRLKLQVAARLERTEVDGSGIIFNQTAPGLSTNFAGKRDFTPFSFSTGALYELPRGVVARVTGQYVERAPDAAELFSKGVHEATGTFEIGNPFLEKEKAATAEIGLKRAKGSFRFDANAYYTRFTDYIFRDLDGTECGDVLASCGVEDELALAVFRQRDAVFYGVEVAAQKDVGQVWHGTWGVDFQYDFVQARFDEGGNVPRIPPHRLGAGIYYSDDNWQMRTGVLHAFKQNRTAVGEISTPGHTLVSAEVSYTTKLEPSSLAPQASFQIGLKGENLLDEEVLNHASFKRREEVFLPGASVRLFGKLRWN